MIATDPERRDEATFGTSETSRRNLLQAAGALGIGSVLTSGACATRHEPAASPRAPLSPTVPTRPFGRTGTRVSSLALGGYFDVLANQPLLEQAMALGITYWETTLGWGGKGYGAYFERHPGDRSKVFLLAKTSGTSREEMDEALTTALTDVGTPYIDFFIIGSLRDGSLLTPDVSRWADTAKASGRIRHFGFSTHSNMEDSLTLASSLGWIDGVMTTYNYRLMHQPRMLRAIEMCARQGIALTAIKSQALETNPEATIGQETPAAARALRGFLDGGQDPFQARLQAIWSNPDISSVCSMMTDPNTLQRNALAASQPGGSGALSASKNEAERTAQGYCAGCANVCESTLGQRVPIADVMRYLMYARSYADTSRGRLEFAKLPPTLKAMLDQHDYSLAEQRCPQRLPIGRLMAEAQRELAQG